MYIIIYISFYIAMKIIKHSKTVFNSSHVQNEALFTWTELLHEYIYGSLDNWREVVFYHTSCWTEMFIQFHSMCKMSTKDISIETVVTSNALHDLKTQPINSYSQIKQIPEHSSINIMNLIYTHTSDFLSSPLFCHIFRISCCWLTMMPTPAMNLISQSLLPFGSLLLQVNWLH